MILQRDNTFKVVFNLRTPSKRGYEVGTGIFVATGNNQIYLVTATHVATTCTSETQVIISDSTGNSTSLNLPDFNSSMTWDDVPLDL